MRRQGGIAAALAALALFAGAGGEPVHAAPATGEDLETAFGRLPPRTIGRRIAVFQLESSAPAVSFECSLDGAPPVACPARVRYTKLRRGVHVFVARAVDGAGNVDATPLVHEFTVRIPRRRFALSRGTVTRWAPVVRRTAVRAKPTAGSKRVARLRTRTPEGTTNLVVVLSRHRGTGGRPWVRVRLPILPNNRTGWVRRSALGSYRTVYSRVVVDRKRLRLTVYRFGKRVFTARVGVGARWSPTPRGEFYVRVRMRSTDPFYGPLAFGLSGRSYVRTDWPGGGFIGIHGTSLPELLPGRVSNGCVRMRNEDILRLAKLIRVGTPVTVE